jgi:hypothetical protein
MTWQLHTRYAAFVLPVEESIFKSFIHKQQYSLGRAEVSRMLEIEIEDIQKSTGSEG